MSEQGMVRALVAPCGTWVGVECTDDEPGFTRTIREAREDLRLGYTEVRADIHEARARLRACQCHCGVLDVTKTGMVFEPDCVTAFRPPKTCPGSTNGFLMLPAGAPAIDVAKCGACGVLVPIRTGREYSQPAQMLKIHAPGSELVPPCEQHAWDDLVLDNERAVCRCERDGGRDGA